MVKIPGSHNFKLVQKNNDIANESKFLISSCKIELLEKTILTII
jgi:hypothetical protein